MKKLIFYAFILFLTVQIIGCQSSTNPYPELLAKENGEYYVLVVDTTNHLDNNKDKLLNDSIRKIMDELKISSENEPSLMYIAELESAQQQYPKLNIENAPAIMIFDSKEMILKTYDLNEAVEFMESIHR